jgi:hypothetical protein
VSAVTPPSVGRRSTVLDPRQPLLVLRLARRYPSRRRKWCQIRAPATGSRSIPWLAMLSRTPRCGDLGPRSRRSETRHWRQAPARPAARRPCSCIIRTKLQGAIAAATGRSGFNHLARARGPFWLQPAFLHFAPLPSYAIILKGTRKSQHRSSRNIDTGIIAPASGQPVSRCAGPCRQSDRSMGTRFGVVGASRQASLIMNGHRSNHSRSALLWPASAARQETDRKRRDCCWRRRA